MKKSLDIRNWRDIDAQYISDIFALNKIDAKVETVQSSPVGTGKIGECVRFTLTLSGNSSKDAPRSLIGKFPADDPHSRSFGADFGMYDREIKFYQILQPTLKVATPKCYLADIDPETQNFVLMMSDAAPALAGNQLKGITLNEAKIVVTAAAKLHGPYWKDDSLNDYPWIINSRRAKPDYDPDMMPPLWAGFLDRYGDKVSKRAKTIGDSLFENFGTYQTYRKERYGLMHLDFRPDNMLFAGPDGGDPISIVDWQSVTYGPVAMDIGYCIAGALDPQLRRDHESELIKLYVQEMESNGAGLYEPEILRRHYVTGGYQLFLTAFSSALMTEQTENGDKMFFKMLNGAVDFIFDHGAETFEY